MQLETNSNIVAAPRGIAAHLPAVSVIAAALLSLCAAIAVDHKEAPNGAADQPRFGHLARGL